MKILKLEQIKDIVKDLDIIPAIEEGFVKYSENKAVIPPVGEMLFDDPPGDVHIKYGYIIGDDYYVIKIASGFYNNPQLGLSSSNGLNLLFNQKTGETVSILLDEGYLTNIRTAAAGAVAAKYLAPEKISRIGVIGTGIQGRLQVQYLKSIFPCTDLIVCGINEQELINYETEMTTFGYTVKTTKDPADVAESCELIITATPSKSPILLENFIKPGTHITAVGADTPEKQELDPGILKKADIVAADSISQCTVRGEIFHALKNNFIKKEKIVELGEIISGKKQGRTDNNQITIADLTGVAVQDLQISKAVFEGFNKQN